MNFKKTIAKSLVVAMALGMVPVANLQTAKAAVTNLKINGATGIATATDGKFWGIAKVDPKGGKGSIKIGDKSYKISNIQEFAGEIDAYSVLKGKAGVIAVGEKAVPDATWKVVEIAAAESTFKAQIVASKGAIKGLTGAAQHALGGDYGYLVGTVGKKEVKEVNWSASKAAIEVKLNDGSWSDFDKFFGDATDEKVTAKLKAYGQNGSTLTFRIKGADNVWASKESKVKVTGQAKAPSVKIDVNKDTTTIKKGIEWQVVEGDAEANKDKWKLSTASKGLGLAELGLDKDKVQTVLVRTGATAKKLASKVGRVTLNKPAAALALGEADGGNKVIKATGSAIKEGNTVLATVESTLAYDITKGATLTNTSKKDIEYALVTDGKVDKFKWNTLKAAKDEKKPTKAALKYSKDNKANTWSNDGKTKLFVRLAGVKQDKNNVATLSGVSAGAVMALTNVAQKLTFKSGTTDNAANSTIDVTNGSTTAAIKITTGAAAKFVIKANVSKVVSAKGGSPKVKATDLPKGVTFKAGKIDPATGDFNIDVVISKNTFKTDVPTTEAKFSFKFEGINEDKGFKITFAKKS